MNPVLILVGVAALALYSTATNTKEQVERLTITGAKIGKPVIQLLNTQLPVLLQINNPNSNKLSFRYFQGFVLYKGKRIANFNHTAGDKDVPLAGRATTPMQFMVSINNLNLGINVAELVKTLAGGKSVSTVFTIDGIYNAGGIDIPVKFSYDVKKNAVMSA